MNGLLRRYCALPRYTLFPREIFRRDEEDRRRRCRGHRRGGLTKYPAEKIRGTAGVVRELCGLGQHRHRDGPRTAVRPERGAALDGRDVGFGVALADLARQILGQLRRVAVRDAEAPPAVAGGIRRLEEERHHFSPRRLESAGLGGRLRAAFLRNRQDRQETEDLCEQALGRRD